MAVVAIRQGRPRMGVLFILGFLGLMRVSELISLRANQLSFYVGKCHVALPDSKGAKLKGSAEIVVVRDAGLIAVLFSWYGRSDPQDLLFPFSYYEVACEMRHTAAFFGGYVKTLSPHSLRRGGATWYFSLHASYDKLMLHGRWAQLSTAKRYVDEAVCDACNHSLNQENSAKLKLAAGALTVSLKSCI
jgi:integrase